jgi:16S rRNA C967 or C1407 C5-methylase (RsmB/RsmF family)
MEVDMKTILLAAKALNDIKQAKLTFADFSNQLRAKEYEQLSSQDKRQVRTFVSCALHKDEIAKFTLLQHGLDGLDPLNRSIVTVFLCNRYFLHISETKEEELVEAITGDNDKEVVKNSDLVFGKVKSLFPEQLDFKTPFALSLRYNFPMNFIDRLIEDLGYNKTQRFLDKYSNVYQIHGRINLNKTTAESFYSENKDFMAINLKDAFVFTGQDSIKSLQSYKDCLFYTMPLSDLAISDQLVQLGFKTALILEQEKTSMLIDLAKQNIEALLHVVVSDKHRYHVVSSVTKMFELNNVKVATNDRSELLDAYDLVYVTPSSSNLEQIKARPDFFITFDLTKDNATNVMTQLNIGKTKVSPGGYLVLKVGSLLKKETSDITAQFLKDNPDFSLLSDRQYMPYHKEQTIAYYALFRKNPINEN